MSKKKQQWTSSRREFLKQAAVVSAGTIVFPTIVPGRALGKDGATAANERIVMGGIATGGRAMSHIDSFTSMDGVQMVAVSDPDSAHLAGGIAKVNEKYGNEDCKGFKNYREMLENKDIDAVYIATPDHWHALSAVHAADAGKHIYCEKPLANSIYEGRKMVEACKRNKVILQTGSQERSGDNARYASELVRSGGIGKLHTIHINLPDTDGHHQAAKAFKEIPPEEQVPEGFDYDLWLGHTPKVPYTPKRTHFMWRFILAYGGGEMTDRGAHVIDIAQLGNGTDGTGPVEIDAQGEQTPGSLYDTLWNYKFTNTYANGVKMIGTNQGKRGLKFEGSDGWIFVEIHGGALEASKPELLNQDEQKKKFADKWVDLGRIPGQQGGHQQNFIDSVRSGKEPSAPVEVGHRTASICHLNNIAMLLKRPLKWDPQQEQFVGDDEANKLVKPPMREPYVF